MANEIAEQPKQTFSDVMLAELGNHEAGLPSGFNKERFVLNAVSLLNEKPELQKYGAAQLKLGLMKAAVMDVDAFRGECWLIPYGQQLQFQMSFKGCKKVAKKYSVRPIKDISAEIVREGDVFEKQVTDDNTTFVFKPKPFNDGPIIGVFAYVQYEDGKCFVEELSKKDIDMVKSKSKSGSSGPWRDFYDQMAKKVAIKRLTKNIELDFENAEQIGIFKEDGEIETKPIKAKTDNPFGDDDVID